MYQGGNAHACCHVERRSAGIASHAHGHIGLEVAQNFLGHASALHDFEEYGYVLQRVLAVEAGNGQPLDGVACCRHALHFHASFSAYKEYLAVGAQLAYSIGNGYGRKDVSSRAATADDDP